MNSSVIKLLAWYQVNSRQLPWRQSSNPYFIWLSEVILQQTRVDQGMPYYYKFIDKYPSIESLANAEEHEVLKLWQGLGYYSRARNMIKTARVIVTTYGGVFPNNIDLLKKLPGIGPYTAAAIASMAYDLPHPVLDGNVYRVLARAYGINTPINSSKAQSQFLNLAEGLMSTHPPSAFNQAMMELGALVCKPVNPSCMVCPFQDMCFAFAQDQTKRFPVKIPKTKQQTIYLTYLVISVSAEKSPHLYMNQRDDTGIWAKLFDFPSFSSNEPISVDEALERAINNRWLPADTFHITHVSNEYKHLLTHRILLARFISVQIDEPISTDSKNSLLLIGQVSLSNYPVPVLVERYLSDSKLIISSASINKI